MGRQEVKKKFELISAYVKTCIIFTMMSKLKKGPKLKARVRIFVSVHVEKCAYVWACIMI